MTFKTLIPHVVFKALHKTLRLRYLGALGTTISIDTAAFRLNISLPTCLPLWALRFFSRFKAPYTRTQWGFFVGHRKGALPRPYRTEFYNRGRDFGHARARLIFLSVLKA